MTINLIDLCQSLSDLEGIEREKAVGGAWCLNRLSVSAVCCLLTVYLVAFWSVCLFGCLYVGLSAAYSTSLWF